MTEYIASSALVGRRPRMLRMRSYSSGFSPSAAYGCSFSGVAAATTAVSRNGVGGVVAFGGVGVVGVCEAEGGQKQESGGGGGRRGGGRPPKVHRRGRVPSPSNHA